MACTPRHLTTQPTPQQPPPRHKRDYKAPRLQPLLPLPTCRCVATTPRGAYVGCAVQGYLRARLIITVIAIIFYVYPDVTDAFVALFACQMVDPLDGPYLQFMMQRYVQYSTCIAVCAVQRVQYSTVGRDLHATCSPCTVAATCPCSAAA